MIGRPFRVEWRPEDTPEALKASYLRKRHMRTRLHGLRLLRSGRRLSAVASVGVHYRTVQMVSRWRGGGSAVPQEGRERQRFRVQRKNRSWPRRCRADDSGRPERSETRIESEYEVSYNGVYSLLHRLGCSPKVPRGLHEKADVLAQSPAWSRPCRSGSDIRDGLGVCR